MTETITTPSFFTVRQFREKHVFLTEGGLRYWIFNSKDNGFDKCVRRIGRKVLISEQDFFAWLESQNQEDKPTLQ